MYISNTSFSRLEGGGEDIESDSSLYLMYEMLLSMLEPASVQSPANPSQDKE